MHEFAELHFLGTALLKKFSPNELVMPRLLPVCLHACCRYFAVGHKLALAHLDRLLSLKGPLKFFDVNLCPPFADPKRIVELAARADLIKLNHDEVGQIASWLRTGEATPNPPGNAEAVAEACAVLTEATKTPRICVTMSAAGATLWDRGNLVSAPAPKVVVKDTVGAGDAFMAGLMVGLTRGADTEALATGKITGKKGETFAAGRLGGAYRRRRRRGYFTPRGYRDASKREFVCFLEI